MSPFQSDWYCWKMGLTIFLGHNGKVASDKINIGTHVKGIKVEKTLLEAFFSDFWNKKEICHCFCKTDIGKSMGWRIVQAIYGFGLKVILNGLECTWTSCSHFWFNFEATDNLVMGLSDWNCRKLKLMDLLGHNGKVTSEKKMICKLYLLYFVFVFCITWFYVSNNLHLHRITNI